MKAKEPSIRKESKQGLEMEVLHAIHLLQIVYPRPDTILIDK